MVVNMVLIIVGSTQIHCYFLAVHFGLQNSYHLYCWFRVISHDRNGEQLHHI